MGATYSEIQCFIAEFDRDIKEAATPGRRRELITRACQRARHDNFSEDEITKIRILLNSEIRRHHYRGTPGRKQPLKNPKMKRK